MLTAKRILSKLNEAGTIWEIYLQVENGKSVTPCRKILSGEIGKCIELLNSKAKAGSTWSGVLVSENAVGNVFFKTENGTLTTSSSPYPGCKHMTAKEFEPFK